MLKFHRNGSFCSQGRAGTDGVDYDIKTAVISILKKLFCPFLAGKVNPSAGESPEAGSCFLKPFQEAYAPPEQD